MNNSLSRRTKTRIQQVLVIVALLIGAVYAGPVYSIAILAIALSAGWLARRFAVT